MSSYEERGTATFSMYGVFGSVRCLANRQSPNLVNFGRLFRGEKIFHGGYLAHFLSERDEN